MPSKLTPALIGATVVVGMNDMKREKAVSDPNSFVYRGAEKYGARFVYQDIRPTDDVKIIPIVQTRDQVIVSVQALEDFVDAVRVSRDPDYQNDRIALVKQAALLLRERNEAREALAAVEKQRDDLA